jgi:2-methylisocitrate lyase-like PEP mutase family enzyme
MLRDLAGKRSLFRELHREGCFVIPNPWDIGTAMFLERLGFRAIATTSAGFAFSRGLPDHPKVLLRDRVLGHIAEMADATMLPLNADFQAGYGETPEEVADSVRLCVGAGVSGLSIEDATGDDDRPLFELSEAVDRLVAAREAIDASGSGVMLTARAECYLVNHPEPLSESIRRLTAYAEAGADVLFAPGPKDLADIREIVDTAGRLPVNAIVTANTGVRVADLAAIGVRRVSVGSSLSRVAWGAFLKAAQLIAQEGSFAGFEGAVPHATLNSAFLGALDD